MTPVEDSQQSEELLGSEENCTAIPNNSVQIRAKSVAELNNNDEAEASSSTAVPVKRRCLPSWMVSAEGNSANKKKKEEYYQQPESTVTSPSTSKVKVERENDEDGIEDESLNQNNHLDGETDKNSQVENSGATEPDCKEEADSGLNLNEEMEIASSTNNDEACNNSKDESEAAAEAYPADEADVTLAPSTSNQTPASSAIQIKTEPNEDNEAIGQVTATSPRDIKPAVKVEKEEATSSTSRISCRFGIRCYRQNQMHRREEAHPGDKDYRRPDYPLPLGNVPPCPYGDLCYRRNPKHFEMYTHPPSTDFKQNWNKHKMRLRERKQTQSTKPDSAFDDDDDDDEETDFIDSSEEYCFDNADVDVDDDDDDEEDEDEDDDSTDDEDY